MNILYFLPLSGLGINLYGFIIGPIFLAMIFYGTSRVISNLQNKKKTYFISKTSLVLIFLSLFFLLTNFGRNSISGYILPLLMFLIMGLVAFESPKIWSHHKMHRNIVKKSFWFLFIICIVELLLSNFFYNFWSVLENSSIYNGSANSYFNFNRIRAFTTEPSNLAKLLVLYHLLFRFYLPKISSISNEKEIYGNFFLIVMTLSNTGILGIIIIEIAALFHRHRQILKKKKALFNFKRIRYLLFFILFAVLSLYFFDFTYKLFERFYLVFVALNENVSVGSVGFRATALIMPFIYLSETSGFYFWVGEGFSNFSEWLLLKYGHLEFSGFAQGQPGNIFSAITLSGGLIGLLIYIIFIIYPYRRFHGIDIICLAFLIFLNLTSGNLTSPFYWGLISIIYGISRVQHQINT